MKEKYLFDYLQPGGKIITPSVLKMALHQHEHQEDPLALLQLEAAACSRCGLRAFSSQVVYGDGPPAARLMIVGEATGMEEEQQGKPFVGAAGQLLNKILTAAEIPRNEVYLTNIVKCRPPENRTPAEDEVTACLTHLQQQIKYIQPKIIVCLGSLAAKFVIELETQVSAVRGLWYERYNAQVLTTFHPAELLQDAAKKRPVWEDIQKVRDAYRLIK